MKKAFASTNEETSMPNVEKKIGVLLRNVSKVYLKKILKEPYQV